MLDRYKDIFTDSTPYLVLFSTLGGCLIRYMEEYRRTKKINFTWLVLDLISSAFLGYLTFWFCVENTDFNLSLCAIATCIVGNLGTRVLDIIRFILFEKIGYKPSGDNNVSKRN